MVILKWHLTCHFSRILASYLLTSVGPQCKNCLRILSPLASKWHFRFRIWGHFFKRRDDYLSGRCRTLNGITPTVIDNELKTPTFDFAKRDFFG